MVCESLTVYSLNCIFWGILVWAVGRHLHTHGEGINTTVSQEAKPTKPVKPTGTFRQGPLDRAPYPCVWRRVLGRIKNEF